ncbi:MULTISPECIES: type I restriction endonuclease subunit R [unclassified Gordonia (in: high G+C Gram-positive bacteria)]|uniref:type I restriction endonuclease subunit R n=1 Tax=Gordonia TaxID=2053 RepID=UPI001B84341E|nr:MULTISPECIES: type I restriction endonuclease subunit R [unclassified Gordonia (in: high G+C Gram-positive bacteria)]MBR7190647.1 type I restriction endonuclease subunit R [Gordonia sp. SCSIO 19800]MDT0220323.1 type I restriction endonuclease subunit R [Gordonia sp. AC31]
MSMIPESEWETLALEWLADQEWQPTHGSEIAPGTEDGRTAWDDIVLPDRLLTKMRELNPDVPYEYLVQARAAILAPESGDPLAENHRLHEILVKGFRGISYVDHEGLEQTPTIRLIGARPEDNEMLAVQQVTVRNSEHQRRFDVVVYLNGLPVAFFELKQAGSAQADLASAHAQLRTYLHEFPMVFRFAVISVISDGITARYGTPFTPLEHFAPWNVDDDGKPIASGHSNDPDKLGLELEYLIDGVFNSERFLQILRNFTAFDAGADGYLKRIAKPHQYFAVTKAVGNTVAAAESNGKAGVVWHTQGSGKSMEMELYAHLVARQPKLKNPTIVVVTDRRELDGQLFETFNRSELLDESPVKVTSREQLRDELSNRTTGGIYFTTLQKFSRTQAEREAGADHPLLTDRRNVIVVVDEAHRSHYDDLDGYARHLADAVPHATLIAFTGTPISFAERNTREVFGPYIDIYDLTRAVDDGATVPVYFEPRLIKVGLTDEVTEDDLDRAADEATRGLDDAERAQIEKSVAVINAVYGAPERVKALAADIVEHWDGRSASLETFISTPGKAFVVTATRDIAARLYEEIVTLRPEWHDDAVDRGIIKVVYSGSAKDQGLVAKHVRRDAQNKIIQKRLKDADDELQIVIVKDMMLTGFDAPPLHTLYLDRPLKGALLMQTLARVNRTFRGKPSGLLVAYAPLADNLHKALAEYTETDQAQQPVGRNIDEAVALTQQLLAQLDDVCSGYDWRSKAKDPDRGWMKAAVGLTEYLRSPETPGNAGSEDEETLGGRYRSLSAHLARAWALAGGEKSLGELRPTVQFYEEVRVWMGKFDAADRQAEGRPVPEEIKRLLSSLVARSTASGEIVDIYDAAGLPKPSLSDLGPDFETKAKAATNPHLAIEALRATLTEESARATRNNVVRQRDFSERITDLMKRYTNQQITSAEVIAELIAMAKEVAAEGSRGERFSPALSEDELAFYDAVAKNESAVEFQGDEVLAQIARELVRIMQRDTKFDWTVRDDVRAKLRSSIKRLLVKYKYPPDKQPAAITTVFEQMEMMAPRFAAENAPGDDDD